MRYRVWHRTAYRYEAEVLDSLGIHHLAPRELPWQRVSEHAVTVTPGPAHVAPDTDYFGNPSTVFHVTAPHDELVLEASALVDVDDAPPADAALAVPWEDARPLADPTLPGAWRAAEFALPSPRVDGDEDVAAYAARSLTPGRPLGEAVLDLTRRIHADFAYDGTATTVTSTVADVWRTRAGVCQDFAHLQIAGLRAHGLAARYVSGYLATTPPPGRERVFGADASHAWLAVWVPGSPTWLAVDPTNDQVAGERYVTVAWGRDYGDVSPVRGIIVTDSRRSELSVRVDVAPVEG